MIGNWHNGVGLPVKFSIIINDIRDHTHHLGKVYIGCDSQLSGKKCTFVTAICLHGGDKRTSKYFFKKENNASYDNRNLRKRIDDEVSKAIDVFMYLSENIPDVDIEIHIDIGNTERSATRGFVDSITGWVKALGADCKIKPNAWASASVADKHTK
jgi:hypothetical protein